MIYGHTRISTDDQSVGAQVTVLTAAGAEKVFHEVSSGAKTDRAQLRRVLDALGLGDVLDELTREVDASPDRSCRRQALLGAALLRLPLDMMLAELERVRTGQH